MVELNVKFGIENLYGGDGFEREVPREVEVFQVKKSKEVERYGNVSLDDATEKTKKVVIDKIQTFKIDGNGKHTQRLGGAHGKLWGSLRATGIYLVECGNEILLKHGIKSMAGVKRMMGVINLSPTYPELNGFKKEEIWVDEIPQIMNGMNKGMVIQRFDVIPKSECDMKIMIPDRYKEVVKELLRAQEDISTLNKRRSTVKVLKIKENGKKD